MKTNHNENINILKKEYMAKEMSQEQINAMKAAMEQAKKDSVKSNNVIVFQRVLATAAAFLMAFIILPNTSGTVAYAMSQIPMLGRLVEVVTFRDYQYEDERNVADVEVPELIVAEEKLEETPVVTKPVAGEALIEETSAAQKEETLQKSMEEINAEILAITEPFVEEFKTNLENEEGYQEVVVNSEVIATTSEYFTLKLSCYTANASGAEWNYYYTIDLNTGERLLLKDVFEEGADYITPISENIKKQMEEQMAADEMVYYWLHDEMEEDNFKEIAKDQSFYINEKGEVVICFNEGDVAPMYMGVVEFVIEETVVKEIRK